MTVKRLHHESSTHHSAERLRCVLTHAGQNGQDASMTQMTQPAVVPDWTLGWRMKRALSHAGIKAEDMADELGVTRQTISRWVNDVGAPPRSLYVKEWALRTGVDYSWLIYGTTAPNTDGGERARKDLNLRPSDYMVDGRRSAVTSPSHAVTLAGYAA